MTVIDAQVHLNMVGLDEGLVAMDAAGVDAVVIDEFISPNPEGLPQSGFFWSDTGFRYETPFSEGAVNRAPHRFAYLSRVQPQDPELENLIGHLRHVRGRVALRLIPHRTIRPGTDPPEFEFTPPIQLRRDIRSGLFDGYFRAAERHGVPVFLQLSGVGLRGDIDLFGEVARRFPDLPLVVDHMGLDLPGAPGSALASGLDTLRDLDPLVAFPNITLKWGHVIRLSREPYPYSDVRAALHGVIERFGASRVMWASDWTVDLEWNSWAQALHTIADDDQLSPTDKAMVLGGTVRSVLGWPA